MDDWMIDERMMKVLVQTLREGNHSLTVSGDPVLTFDGRGVADLFRLLHESPEVLQGALAADKVVGKGAAALMAVGQVKEVFAEVISRPALDLLRREGIRTTYGRLVAHIINREGTGLCPVEARCMDCQTPEECLGRIEEFLREMRAARLQRKG